MTEPARDKPQDAPPRRGGWLIGVGLIVAAALWQFWPTAVYRAPQVQPQRRNVLLITLDTTRADALGCYGNAAAPTPHLDRLAAEGAVFTAASTCTSLTLPAHSSIMTGVYPFVHGVRKNGTTRLADANVTLAESLNDAGLQTGAIVASFVLNRMFGLDQGFDTYRDVVRGQGAIALHEERRGDEICDEALAELQQLADDRFFLWVHFYDPHYPYISPRFGEDQPREAYGDELTFMDAQVGRLLEGLRIMGLDRNTLVVVVGDHGEAFSEHGEYQHGYFVYDTTVHVPLLMRLPGVISRGRRVDAVVRTVDVAPTILDLLGREPLAGAQGRSLQPMLTGRTDDLDLQAYAESIEAHVQFGMSRLRALRSGSWKYILAPQPELYDAAGDGGETSNVIAEHPEVAAEMRARLAALIGDAPQAPQEASPLDLSPADVARLAALGYVAGEETATGAGGEMASFEPDGEDPKNHTETIMLYSQAHWATVERRLPLAEDLLGQLIERLPESPRVRADLAYVLQQQNRAAEAETHYLAALELAPGDGYIRRMYGGLLVRTQRWSDAADQLKITVRERPDDLEAWYNLGIAVAMQGHYAESREYLTRVLEIDPRHTSSLHAMGAAWLQEGDPERAADFFRRTLAVDSDHARARSDLRRLEPGGSDQP